MIDLLRGIPGEDTASPENNLKEKGTPKTMSREQQERARAVEALHAAVGQVLRECPPPQGNYWSCDVKSTLARAGSASLRKATSVR
jgi:hypothetical protein